MSKIDKEQFSYKHALVTRWDRSDSLSLGMFIFISKGLNHEERILKHEYGHSLQSCILGPFYLFIIGIPSYIHANVKAAGKKWREGKESYFDFFPERWADKLGGVTAND